MSIVVILLVVAVVAVIAYFLFFNESKQAYPESKIREAFAAVDNILKPYEDDHRFIISKKEKIIEELRVVRQVYSRIPSEYTQEEIAALEKLLPELKQELREFCDTLIEFKPKIIALIESEKRMLKSAEEAMKTGGEVGDDSDEYEDVMDTMEKILEFSPITIKEKEDELLLLERSITRYRSI